MLPHLDAAFRLARWLVGEVRAADVVQEAYLLAYSGFDSFAGINAKSWLLTITRRVSYAWLDKHRRQGHSTEFDESEHGIHGEHDQNQSNPYNRSPLELLEVASDRSRIINALKKLPDYCRAVLVLREIEGLSYQEIAEVEEVPVGTVMSRLSRGRKRLALLLLEEAG